MVEKKKEVNSDEVLAQIIGEPQINGFRKGVNKKTILKNLTKEDWVRLDKMQEAEERKVENEIAYKCFIMNDQLRTDFEAKKDALADNITTVIEMDNLIRKNEVDISLDKTEQKDEQGRVLTIQDLEISNMKLKVNIRRAIRMITNNLNHLYLFVGKEGLDRKKFFSEEEYNAIAKNTIHELKQIGYNLL